jgi:hypothetical protein
VARAHLHMRLVLAILVATVIAACGDSSASLSGPSGVARGSVNGAVITGRVSGISLRASTFDGIAATTGTTAGATTLRVTIAGTNISTMVDGTGQFTMNGVPPGTVTLTFAGEGVSASITLNNVNAGDEIRIDVRLNGANARIESENRHRRDDDNDDDDDANEVKGTVSGLTGTCPDLTFTVGTRVVRTGSATVFDDRCTDIRNGVRVEATGTRAENGTFTATRVEVDN